MTDMSRAKAIEILRRAIPWAMGQKKISAENYKGQRGRIGIVGGARDYAGAPYFASISAMHLGADLAYVICSSTAAQAIKNYSPDLIVLPLLDHSDDSVFDTEINCLLTRLHALVIGPGLGREKLLQARAKRIIELAKVRHLPLVLDADSLLLVNEDPSIIESYPKVILTPNRVELQRLSESLFAPSTFDLRNLAIPEIEKLVRRCSDKLGVAILAKGMVDIICQGDFILKIDTSIGSDRRCGGQGDILSGLIAVYIHWLNNDTSLKIDNFIAWSGYLGAITTRECNKLAHRDYKHGMLASNMIDKIHIAFESLLTAVIESTPEPRHLNNVAYDGNLNQDEINRYRRQMIMENFGPERQMRLKRSSAIIIGAGGLGCPSAIYLAAGGIGRLGLVDDDVVEMSNLHRQILHNLKKVGMLKTESIKEAVLDINPNVQVDLRSIKMTRHNAVKLIEDYDMVIDATDNLLTRYMISDACVIAKKPLISGAALGMDGQLTVYNYDKKTPCFRCLFPEPPPSAAVGSCSENGVLGVVPGIIGVQQAMEAIRIGAGLRPAYAGKMLLYDGELGRTRQVILSDRRKDCAACGPDSKLDRSLIDYDAFCKIRCSAPGGSGGSLLNTNERITLEDYCDILESSKPHVLIDVRPLAQSQVSRFAHAIQIPLNQLNEEKLLKFIVEELKAKNCKEVYVVCRRGIASQKGVRWLREFLEELVPGVVIKDLIGGMTEWADRIDSRYSCL